MSKSTKHLFETKVNKLYKLAVEYNIPSTHIITKEQNGVIEYLNSHELIFNDLGTENLINTFLKYRRLNSKIGQDLIIYIYYNQFDDENKLEKVIELDKYDRVGNSKFINMDTLTNYIKLIGNNYETIKKEDIERLQVINEGVSILSSNYIDYPFSGYNITGKIINMTPTFNDKTRPVINQGIDIFDSCVATIFTPFIRYTNSKEENLYKVIDSKINYKVPESSFKIKDTFYIIIWLENLSEGIDFMDPSYLSNANSTSFHTVIYNIKEGTLDLNLPNTDIPIDTILNRLKISFPMLSFKNINSTKIKGNFDLYPLGDNNIVIDETTFLHFLLIEEINRYLYVEEKLKPFCYKKRLDIHWSGYYSRVGEQVIVHRNNGTSYPLADSSIALTLHLVTNSNSFDTESGLHIPEKSDWVRVTIIGGASEEDLKVCINYLRSTFNLYMQSKKDIYGFYNSINRGNLSELNYKYQVREDIDIDKISGHKVTLLKKQAPEIFVNDYARLCTGEHQPIIIPKDEVKNWKKNTFNFEGKLLHKQVLPFPKDNPKYYFGCGDKYPFPGVKRNKTLSNNKEFEFLPCCYSQDQMDPNKFTGYNEYHGIESGKEVVKKSMNKYKVNRFADKGGIANVPVTLNLILSSYRTPEMYPGFEYNWEFVRYGVPDSNNSLLHCILEAISDKKYNGKEEYVREVRVKMANAIEPYLLKQEMYDYDIEEILEKLRNPDVYLDPDLYYRALEEYFCINIYVFEIGKLKDIQGEAIIKLPRHKNFHVRNSRNEKPTVLIVNHHGASSYLSEIPKCELLVDYNQTSKAMVKLFDFNMSQLAYDLLKSAGTIITWNSKLIRLENFYNQYDYDNLSGLNGKLVSQYIDSFGKARCYNFDYGKLGSISYITLPGQPANVPVDISYHEAKYENVIKILKKAEFTSRTVDDNGRTTGLWIRLFELEEGIYVPLVPNNVCPKLPKGSDNPLKIRDDINHTKRYIKLVRDYNIILDLLEWFYELERRENPESVAERIHEFVAFSDYEGDSSEYYDFSNLPRKLPIVKNTSQAIKYLNDKNVTKNIFKKYFTLHNQEFHEKMMIKMKEFEEKTKGLPPLIKTYIDNYYLTDSDFKPYKNNTIIIGSSNFDKWLNSRSSNSSMKIEHKLNLSVANNMIPTIYMDDNQVMWLIQNTYSGGLLEALALCINWYKDSINTGSRTKPILDNQIPPHFIYIIGASGKLITKEDNTEDQEIYFCVIRYNNSYGAMLPLN